MTEKIRPQNQDDWKRTQVRVPQEQYQAIIEYAESKNISLNSAILDLMEVGLASKQPGKSGRAVYFNDISCQGGDKNEFIHSRTQRVEQLISKLFYDHPQFELINIETINNGEKIRYWYSIPRSESFRD